MAAHSKWRNAALVKFTFPDQIEAPVKTQNNIMQNCCFPTFETQNAPKTRSKSDTGLLEQIQN